MKPNTEENHKKGQFWPAAIETARAYKGSFLTMTGLLAVGSILEVMGIGFVVPLIARLFGSNMLQDSQLQGIMSRLGLAGISTGALLLLILGFMSVRTLLLFKSSQIAGMASVSVERDLRDSIFKSLMEANWEYNSALKAGWVSNLATQEAGQAGYAVQFLARFYVAAFLSIVFFATAVTFSLPAFILTVIITIPLLIIGKSINKKSQAAAKSRLNSANRCNAQVIESLAQAKLIKSTDGASHAIGRERAILGDMIRAMEKNVTYQSLMLTLPDAFLLVALVSLVAASQILRLSAPADFIFFLLLMFRAQRFIGQAQSLQQRTVSLMPSYVACRALIAAAEDAREDIHAGGAAPKFANAIELQGVNFSYRLDLPVLRNISLSIPCRRTSAFAGRSGSGKTTLVDLLTGLLTPSSGKVLVDGEDLAGLDLRAWRRKLAYVPQEPVLFNGTLRENIMRDAPEASAGKFDEIARLAHIDEFALKLPQEYDTPVGDRGVLFSGGQKQRISLARALMRQPEILILDEATSALDALSEEHIKQSLRAIRNSVTIIIIAHRFSTIRDADVIFVIEDGQLVQSGRYDELRKGEGLFSQLSTQDGPV